MSDPVPVSPPVPASPAEREQFWREAITGFPASGLSVRAYCVRHGLHEKRFYTWRRNLGLSPADPVRADDHPGVRPGPGRVRPGGRDRPPGRGHGPGSGGRGPDPRRPPGHGPAGCDVLTLGTTGTIYLGVEPQDGRKGIDGLAAVVVAALKRSPTSGDLFVFKNNKGDRLKIVAWMGDGFALYLRRLERGTFAFPPAAGTEVAVTPTQLALILGGLDLAEARPRKRYAQPSPPDSAHSS